MEDAADDALYRMLGDELMAVMPTMKRCGAAAATLIAGKRGRDMLVPEPLVQVGFEPSEGEMKFLVATAHSKQRDLVHVSCHRDHIGGPTGMIAVVYLDNGRPQPHRRCGLLCEPGGTRVILAGLSDEGDEPYHFIFATGRKIVRHPGWPVSDVVSGFKRAGDLWRERFSSGALGDCEDEPLGVYTVVEAKGESE